MYDVPLVESVISWSHPTCTICSVFQFWNCSVIYVKETGGAGEYYNHKILEIIINLCYMKYVGQEV